MREPDIFQQARAMQRQSPSALRASHRIGQIGIVAEDLAVTSEALSARHGIRTWYQPHTRRCTVRTDGQELDVSLVFLIAYCEGVQIELVRVSGPDRARYTGVGDAVPSGAVRGDTRVHHVGCFVDDVSAWTSRLKQDGLDSDCSGVLKFGPKVKTRFAYWDCRAEGGGIVELIEHRISGFRADMPEWLVQFGALTGQVERRPVTLEHLRSRQAQRH